MISDVSQGSILGPLFLNIHMCDLFFIIEEFDIVNFADDNTPYVIGEHISFVVNFLEKVTCGLKIMR